MESTGEQTWVVVSPENVPEPLVCSICLGVVHTPVVTPCHHVFCRSCIVPALRESERCPIDRRSLNENQLKALSSANPILSRIWGKLKVKCRSHAKGCAWTGELSAADTHATRCDWNESKSSSATTRKLKQQVQALEYLVMQLHRDLEEKTDECKQLREEHKRVRFDRSYRYGRDSVVELSQLISKYLMDKPSVIDRNKIFNCLKLCYDDYKRGWGDNPSFYSVDLQMALATAAASTWFSNKQLGNISRWLDDVTT
uniref:RING-type domain-containing protein n=1 Tax=Lotharella globosa TaxID=91324 RepID=A0A7S3ZAA5_9EUKA